MMEILEDACDRMNPVSRKTAMHCFLDRTVAEYIKSLFNSNKAVQKIKLIDLLERLSEDIQSIKGHFSEHMTERSMKKGLDLINNFVNFLESEPSFLPLVVVQLRQSVGPCFNQSALKILINLRTDLSKDQK